MFSPLQLTRFGARLIDLRATTASCNPFCVDRTTLVSGLRWTLHMISSANKTAKTVSLYSIALRLTLAGCAAHYPTATRHSLRRTAAAASRGAWSAPGFDGLQLLARVAFYLSQLSTSYANLSWTWVQSNYHHRDHAQQDLVRSLEVLLYFKYRT